MVVRFESGISDSHKDFKDLILMKIFRSLALSFIFLTCFASYLHAEVVCDSVTASSLDSDYASLTKSCSDQKTELTVQVDKVTNMKATFDTTYSKAVKAYGKKCIDTLIKNGKSNRCHTRKLSLAKSVAAKIATSYKKLSKLISNANKLATTTQSTCDKASAKNTEINQYIESCPPINIDPPPSDIFRPDLSAVPFSTDYETQTTLSDPNWIKSRWINNGNLLEAFGISLYTNGRYFLSYFSKCPITPCFIQATGLEFGQYTFDGTTLIMTGSMEMTYNLSDGTQSKQTVATSRTFTISMVHQTDIFTYSGDTPLEKYGLIFTGTNPMRPGQDDGLDEPQIHMYVMNNY